MKKRSFHSIVERCLRIYWDRAQRYQLWALHGPAEDRDRNNYFAAKYLGKNRGMAILYERVDLKGK